MSQARHYHILVSSREKFFSKPKISFLSKMGIGFLGCALLAAYPLCQILPRSFGWENGVLENTQAFVLFLGFGFALYFAYRTRKSLLAKLWLAATPFWFFLFGRELAWGADFLPPLRIDLSGPVLPSSNALWYKPAVYPLLAVFLLWGLYLFFKNRLYRILFELMREKRFPFVEFGIAVLAFLISTSAEHHGFIRFEIAGGRNQLLEELTELLFDLGLFITQLNVFFQTSLALNKFQRSR